MSIISLIYHDVMPLGSHEESGRRGPGPALYKLGIEQFEAHLVELDQVDAGLRTDWARAIARPSDPAVLLTFDDGGIAAVRHIAPMLRDHGWRGHFFVTARMVGQPGYIGRQDIRSLAADGHVIGTHSASHPDRFAALAPAEQAREWAESIATLSDILGESVRVGSVPGGLFDANVARVAAEAGLHGLFTSEPRDQLDHVDGCSVLGRYSITRRSSAREVRELVFDCAWRRQRHSAVWALKSAVRTAGGEPYLRARRIALGVLQARNRGDRR